MDKTRIEHIKFIKKIDKQIDNLVNSEKEERYSRLIDISKQIIDYKRKSWINIF